MTDKTFEELKQKVLDWADSHELLKPENANKQFGKFIEEVFEYKTEFDILYRYRKFYRDRGEDIPSGHIAEHGRITNKAKMEMGDIFVTLVVHCDQLGIDPVECLEMAYKKIKDRKGKTVDGQFIKAEDLE